MQINTTFFKLNKIPILLTLASLLFYFSFAYNLTRTDYVKLITLFIALCYLAFKLIQIIGYNFKFLLVVSILSRLIFIVAIPNLSQDFYRFIWDGYLNLNNLNPYLFTPTQLVDQTIYIPNKDLLYNKMGWLSNANYSNYPPVNQLCFIIANLCPGQSILSSVIGLRLLIILADLGIILIGSKLLLALNLPKSKIFWYALNPFIIIELTGNLHFEGVMLFFFILGIYLIYKNKISLAGMCIGLSISIKLIPLIFLPVLLKWFLQHFNIKKTIQFYSIIGLTVLITCLPYFTNQFIDNYSQTIALWFNNFEFNASIYYIARHIGYKLTGYNQIAIIGKFLSVTIFFIILILSFVRKTETLKQVLTTCLLAFTTYLFLSTTVHPWYLSTLVLFSIFSNYKYPLVWSVTIILSYLAYINTNNTENLWIVFIEYLIVYLVFTYELLQPKLSRNQ
ncbi:glycosyltransferase 87 family protein [Mesoflavibacter profundi]|uniref:glycosyltransferase 87 family protein n=1 Tax=Mesoflavibacter profundi TaxID=2708110 RepID=UPI00243947B7